MSTLRTLRRPLGHALGAVLLGTFLMTVQAQADTVLVQAHRGYSEVYPENTLRAIDEAFAVGADRVETDLSLTADGVVVLMHDRTVDRTTDGSGRVASFTLEELRELDAGRWKHERFAGEGVPTLEEALRLAEGRGELNLEIKSNGRTLLQILDVVEAALAVVEEHDARERVVFSSFDHRALDAVRERDPQQRVLIIDWSEGGGGSGMEIALNNDYYGAALDARFATPERLARAEAGGLFVHVGASPGPALTEFVENGVDGFSANDPAALVAYLQERGLHP